MSPSPTAAELRVAFDRPAPLTLGIEEELVLLHPATLELSPRAREIVASLAGDEEATDAPLAANGRVRAKVELPAAQLEIATPPAGRVAEAIALLREGRRALCAATRDMGRLAALAVHPFAPAEGELNRGERYERTLREHAIVARRQLVCALQVHVAVGGAERTLAVFDAFRARLPEIAALAAAAPFAQGSDTGLASVRPVIAGQLPRQGIPPPIESWEAFADDLRWGAASGTVPEPRGWWWELRPHPAYGTLEMRVPDPQATLADVAAVAAVVHSLVARLAAAHEAGEPRGPAPATWRLEENRWSACRYGVEGTLADPWTGERVATRSRLHGLLDELAPDAAALGCGAELDHARALVEVNGAMTHRRIAREAGVEGLVRSLADRFLDDRGAGT
jgi:carboxylate-amine ligase